jgi:hypothetical protein
MQYSDYAGWQAVLIGALLKIKEVSVNYSGKQLTLTPLAFAN